MAFNINNGIAAFNGWMQGQRQWDQDQLNKKLMQYQMQKIQHDIEDQPARDADEALRRKNDQLNWQANQEKFSQEYTAPQFGLGDLAAPSASVINSAMGLAGVPAYAFPALTDPQAESQDQMNDTRVGPSVMRSTIGLPLQSRDNKLSDRKARDAAYTQNKLLQYKYDQERADKLADRQDERAEEAQLRNLQFKVDNRAPGSAVPKGFSLDTLAEIKYNSPKEYDFNYGDLERQHPEIKLAVDAKVGLMKNRVDVSGVKDIDRDEARIAKKAKDAEEDVYKSARIQFEQKGGIMPLSPGEVQAIVDTMRVKHKATPGSAIDEAITVMAKNYFPGIQPLPVVRQNTEARRSQAFSSFGAGRPTASLSKATLDQLK